MGAAYVPLTSVTLREDAHPGLAQYTLASSCCWCRVCMNKLLNRLRDPTGFSSKTNIGSHGAGWLICDPCLHPWYHIIIYGEEDR